MDIPVRPEARLKRIRAMSNTELLDRVTVLLDGMDVDAVELFHAELASRGLGPDEIGAHLREMRMNVVQRADGVVATCHRCGRAAVGHDGQWHRLWGVLPLFRRQCYWCAEHRPTKGS